MIPDQGKFLRVHYNIRLISNLFYGHFKVPKRLEAHICLFPLSIDFFVRRGLQEIVPDQGEFLSVHYNIRLKFIYNLFYCHFKAAKR